MPQLGSAASSRLHCAKEVGKENAAGDQGRVQTTIQGFFLKGGAGGSTEEGGGVRQPPAAANVGPGVAASSENPSRGPGAGEDDGAREGKRQRCT